MENSNDTLIYPNRSNITEMSSIIPKEFEVPVMVFVFIFLAIAVALGLSKFSSTNKVQFETKESVKSPVKSLPNSTVTTNGTPIEKKTGTIMTPAGRRSARLVRRKED